MWWTLCHFLHKPFVESTKNRAPLRFIMKSSKEEARERATSYAEKEDEEQTKCGRDMIEANKNELKKEKEQQRTRARTRKGCQQTEKPQRKLKGREGGGESSKGTLKQTMVAKKMKKTRRGARDIRNERVVIVQGIANIHHHHHHHRKRVFWKTLLASRIPFQVGCRFAILLACYRIGFGPPLRNWKYRFRRVP